MNMDRVNLIAVTPFKYGGRSLAVGDTFSATRQHAGMFIAIKKARHAEPDTPNPQQDPTVIVEPNPRPAPSAEYRTADVQAGPDETPVVRADVAVDAKPMTSRTYRRRDMTAKT